MHAHGAHGQFTQASCQDSSHKGWGYCGNPSKFSHMGGMGISFSLAASLEAPCAQLFEMQRSWMWQSKSHRISDFFRHIPCVSCSFGNPELAKWDASLESSRAGALSLPNNFGISGQCGARWWKFQHVPSTNWDHMIWGLISNESKFDKRLCPPRRPGRVHGAIESKCIKCTHCLTPWQQAVIYWCWQGTVLRGLGYSKMQNILK